MEPTPDARGAPAPMAREVFVHHTLTRITDLPIVASGELSGGHVWGLALGIGRHGVEGHVTLGWPRGGAIVTGIGTRGYHDGRRFFIWNTSLDVDRIELTTTRPGAAGSTPCGAVEAVRLHDAPEHQLRVFLAVIDDGNLVLRSVRHLDRNDRVLTTENLAKDQKRFEARQRWVDDARRYGLDGQGQPAYPRDT